MHSYKYLEELQAKSSPVLFDDILQEHFKLLTENSLISESKESLADCSEIDLIALDQWAQRILLLVKHCEPAVLKNAYDNMNATERRLYRQAENECDRFLWTCQKSPKVFDEACQTLPMSALRDGRSTLRCTMYALSKDTALSSDFNAFHEALEDVLWYSRGNIVVECESIAFDRDGKSAKIHDITVTYNTLSESIKAVEKRNLTYTNVMRSNEFHIVYHQDGRMVEIYTPTFIPSAGIAEAFSKTVLNSPGSMRKQKYCFQHLTVPVELPLLYESIKSAKVSTLKFLDKKVESSYFLKKDSKKPLQDLVPNVPKVTADSEITLSGVSITVDIGRTLFPSQTTTIEFLSEDAAYIHALTPADRWRWHSLLMRWGILQGGASAELIES